ncbi:MAG: nitroreductase family protein [Dehalococcoidia bacterium]
MTDVLPALTARRARRAFDPRPLPEDALESLYQAVSLAPSHGNNQPVRLLVARDPDIRAEVFAALSEGNREWAGAAPALVAVAAIPDHDTVAKNRDGGDRPLWPFHAGIATGNLLAQATSLGLIAHPMAGFDEAAVRAAFGAPAEVRVLAVVALGFPGPVEALVPDLQKRELAPQRRLPLSHLVADGVWRPENGLSWREYRESQPPR